MDQASCLTQANYQREDIGHRPRLQPDHIEVKARAQNQREEHQRSKDTCRKELPGLTVQGIIDRRRVPGSGSGFLLRAGELPLHPAKDSEIQQP